MLTDLLPPSACSEARGWLASLPAETTPQQAWDTCQRGDWLLWLLSHHDCRAAVRAAALCAREALCHTEAPEALAAIEAAERWAEDPSEDRWRDAATAAGSASRASASAARAADYANYAAASAASAADYAASRAVDYVARAADYAAYAAADAAADAAAYAASGVSLARSADLVRSVCPDVPVTQVEKKG